MKEDIVTESIARLTRFPPKERSKVRLRPRPRGRRKVRERFDREQLAEYMKANGVHSVRQLLRCRKENDPGPWDFRRAFEGSWSKAIEAVWGKPPRDPFAPERPTHDYLLRCFNDLGVRTRDAWVAARRGGAVPSIAWVRRLFGNWGNLSWLAEQRSFKLNSERYAMLVVKLGRTPTGEELRTAGVRMDALHRVFKNKREVDRVYASLPRLAASLAANSQVF